MFCVYKIQWHLWLVYIDICYYNFFNHFAKCPYNFFFLNNGSTLNNWTINGLIAKYANNFSNLILIFRVPWDLQIPKI